MCGHISHQGGEYHNLGGGGAKVFLRRENRIFIWKERSTENIIYSTKRGVKRKVWCTREGGNKILKRAGNIIGGPPP